MTSYTDALEHTASATYNEFDQPRTITVPISATKNLTTTYSYIRQGQPDQGVKAAHGDREPGDRVLL